MHLATQSVTKQFAHWSGPLVEQMALQRRLTGDSQKWRVVIWLTPSSLDKALRGAQLLQSLCPSEWRLVEVHPHRVICELLFTLDTET
jgi:hypothetical protein